MTLQLSNESIITIMNTINVFIINSVKVVIVILEDGSIGSIQNASGNNSAFEIYTFNLDSLQEPILSIDFTNFIHKNQIPFLHNLVSDANSYNLQTIRSFKLDALERLHPKTILEENVFKVETIGIMLNAMDNGGTTYAVCYFNDTLYRLEYDKNIIVSHPIDKSQIQPIDWYEIQTDADVISVFSKVKKF